MKTDVYSEVTNKIVSALETAGEWKRPWFAAAGTDATLPINLDGRPYRGVNVFLLWITAKSQNYGTQVWGTYKAWAAKDAQVGRGEKGTEIIFWGSKTIADEKTGEPKRIMWAKFYHVFNAAQVTGYTPKARPEAAPLAERETIAHDALCAYIKREHIGATFNGDGAYYVPALDSINMPLRKLFKSNADYVTTLAHECGHSTGAQKRLNREFGKRFGGDAYAMEELVAEMTSAFFAAASGLCAEPRKDHAQYVAHWIKALKNDKRAIFTAASKAQAACDMIQGKREAESDEESDDAASVMARAA